MATPYRAVACDRGSWCQCQDCDWSGDHGAEDHCERTGHRVRAERWKYYKKHCRAEAYPPSGDTMMRPPGIKGKALFFEMTDYETGEDWFEILDTPSWVDLIDAASRMMIATEDTHHCFLEGFERREESAETWKLRSRAIDAGLHANDLPVYRLCMGS